MDNKVVNVYYEDGADVLRLEKEEQWDYVPIAPWADPTALKRAAEVVFRLRWW